MNSSKVVRLDTLMARLNKANLNFTSQLSEFGKNEYQRGPEIQEAFQAFRKSIEQIFDELYHSELWWDKLAINFLKDLVHSIEVHIKRIHTTKTALDEQSKQQTTDQFIYSTKKIILDRNKQIIDETLRDKIALSYIERHLYFCLSMPDSLAAVTDVEKSFEIRWQSLKDLYNSKKTSLEDLANLAESASLGFAGSASHGLNMMVIHRVIASLDNDPAIAKDPAMVTLLTNLGDDKMGKDALMLKLNACVKAEADAFRKIYTALREGQSGIFKTNFLSRHKGLPDFELIREVMQYSEDFPDSRTAKAWKLVKASAIQQYDVVNNDDLFTRIYKRAFKRSGILKVSTIMQGFTFFSATSLESAQAAPFSKADINAGLKKIGSRANKIGEALGRKPAI